jgi:hypothetical protein
MGSDLIRLARLVSWGFDGLRLTRAWLAEVIRIVAPAAWRIFVVRGVRQVRELIGETSPALGNARRSEGVPGLPRSFQVSVQLQ